MEIVRIETYPPPPVGKSVPEPDPEDNIEEEQETEVTGRAENEGREDSERGEHIDTYA